MNIVMAGSSWIYGKKTDHLIKKKFIKKKTKIKSSKINTV